MDVSFWGPAHFQVRTVSFRECWVFLPTLFNPIGVRQSSPFILSVVRLDSRPIHREDLMLMRLSGYPVGSVVPDLTHNDPKGTLWQNNMEQDPWNHGYLTWHPLRRAIHIRSPNTKNQPNCEFWNVKEHPSEVLIRWVPPCWFDPLFIKLSHEKNPPILSINTGWSIGILIMVYCNPYISG